MATRNDHIYAPRSMRSKALSGETKEEVKPAEVVKVPEQVEEPEEIEEPEGEDIW